MPMLVRRSTASSLVSSMSFVSRMQFWLGGPGVANFDNYFIGHGDMLLRAFKALIYSMGWPMFMAIILSLAYCIYRYRWESFFGFMPIVFFYLIIIVNMKFPHSRYFIPGYSCLVLPLHFAIRRRSP